VPDARREAKPDARAADHAEIERLSTELLPALVAKLAATGLGEIEVREGDWKVRLRRPGDGPSHGRRATDRPSRAQPGHSGHGHAPAALEGHRAARPAASTGHSSNGSGPQEPVPVGPARTNGGSGSERRRSDGDQHRAVATSPAVGVYRPSAQIRAGTRVRAGDRLGSVDMLGVPQEVIAPADGIVGASLAESGDAVEYGQDLVIIEMIGATARAGDPALDDAPTPSEGEG
jgi:biotin carboxyl carrier protein